MCEGTSRHSAFVLNAVFFYFNELRCSCDKDQPGVSHTY